MFYTIIGFFIIIQNFLMLRIELEIYISQNLHSSFSNKIDWKNFNH